MTRAIRRKRIIFIILEREKKKDQRIIFVVLYQQQLNVGAYRRPIDVTAMSRPTQ
jgi:hypothetical protein